MSGAMAEGKPHESLKGEPEVNSAVQTVDGGEEDDNGVTEIESLCMNCHDDVGAGAKHGSNLGLI